MVFSKSSSKVSAFTSPTFSSTFYRATRYTGGEEIVGKERWALERGPLLYAALGAPTPVRVRWDPRHPEDWFTPQPGSVRTLRLKGDNAHEYRAYTDIHDEPFSVYPIVEPCE